MDTRSDVQAKKYRAHQSHREKPSLVGWSQAVAQQQAVIRHWQKKLRYFPTEENRQALQRAKEKLSPLEALMAKAEAPIKKPRTRRGSAQNPKPSRADPGLQAKRLADVKAIADNLLQLSAAGVEVTRWPVEDPHPRTKQILLLDPDGAVHWFQTLQRAADQIGISIQSVSSLKQGIREQIAKGWRPYDPELVGTIWTKAKAAPADDVGNVTDVISDVTADPGPSSDMLIEALELEVPTLIRPGGIRVKPKDALAFCLWLGVTADQLKALIDGRVTDLQGWKLSARALS